MVIVLDTFPTSCVSKRHGKTHPTFRTSAINGLTTVRRADTGYWFQQSPTTKSFVNRNSARRQARSLA